MSSALPPPPESRPLAGRRIVVTRARGQAADLLQRLHAAGAEALALPTIEIAPPLDWAPLDAALRSVVGAAPGAANYDGFIFTSRNGVRAFFDRARELGLVLPPPRGAWVAAIGPATEQSLREHGWRVDVVPEEYVAESLAAALAGRGLRGRRVLLPRAAVARDALTNALRAMGAEVDMVAAYRTVVPADSRAQAQRLFPAAAAEPRPDAVLFTSSSTVRNFCALVGADYAARLSGVVLAAIGPVTSGTLHACGLEPHLAAAEYTTRGLVDVLIGYYRQAGAVR